MNKANISFLILTVAALFPVVSRHTVVTLVPRGAIFTLTEARAVTPVVNWTHLVAVALWKRRVAEEDEERESLEILQTLRFLRMWSEAEMEICRFVFRWPISIWFWIISDLYCACKVLQRFRPEMYTFFSYFSSIIFFVSVSMMALLVFLMQNCNAVRNKNYFLHVLTAIGEVFLKEYNQGLLKVKIFWQSFIKFTGLGIQKNNTYHAV